MRAVDLNGDGVISGLESVIIAGMPTDSILAGVLTKESKRLGKEQLTQAEVRAALRGLATDGQINSLLNKTDVNGRRIWSRQGATNSRLAGLAKGIGSALSPMFSDIDTSLDGLIDYKEFSKAFSGMATDKELRNIFGKLDEDGSGTISRLEALARTGEGTEDNTKSLEERANDQLKELNSLVREMTLTTDQFVGLNSGIKSLTQSINALGVAQAEVARIEREKKAADIEGKGRLEASRVGHARGEYNRRLTASKSDESRLEKQISSLGRQQKNSFGRDASERKLFKDLMGDNPTKADLDRVRKIVAKDTDGWINIAGAGRIRDTRAYAVLDQVEKQLQVSSDLEKARREIDRVKRELRDIRAKPPASTTSELESLRRQYKNVTGKAAPFAKGGVFEMGRVATNSIVSSPTLFDMGLMGEADPEAIVPLSRGDGGRLGVDATGLMRIPDGPLELPMPNVPLPQFPALGSNDVLQVLQDVKRELQESRKENKRLQEENNRHAAAAVAVQQAGFNGQISEAKKSSRALEDMASESRLRGAL